MRDARVVGAFLGLALGDAFGAPHEGGPLERAAWAVLGRTRQGLRRWTDDTQMARDVAESLLARGRVDLDDLAGRFAASYRWDRGYGPGAARLLKAVRRGADWRDARTAGWPEGSLGNGGAMRSPVIGLAFADDPDGLRVAADAVAGITHAHPHGRRGAVIVAQATAACLRDVDSADLVEALVREHADGDWAAPLRHVEEALATGSLPEPPRVRGRLGCEVTALRSVPAALLVGLGLRDAPFDDLLAFVRAMGGDVDTVGAMAGALWGARRGADALPAGLVAALEDADGLRALAEALAAAGPFPRYDPERS